MIKTTRIAGILLATILFLSVMPCFSLAEEPIKVLLNGDELVFDVAPQSIDGRTMVPVRAVCEAIGADVYFVEAERNVDYAVKEIIVVKNEIKLFFSIIVPTSTSIEGGRGSSIMDRKVCADFDEYFLDSGANDFEYFMMPNADPEERIKLDVAPRVVSGRTLVPLRALSEAFGINVDWDAGTKTVILTCSPDFIANQNSDKPFFDEYVKYIISNPSLSPQAVQEDHSGQLPQIDTAVSAEMQDLASEIYLLQDYSVIFAKIVERFGNGNSSIGIYSAMNYHQWTLAQGILHYEPNYGVYYETEHEVVFLQAANGKILGNRLYRLLDITSSPEFNAVRNLGKLLLKDDGTYLYAHPTALMDKQISLSAEQKKAFFIRHKSGSWEIKFEEGYGYDTDVTKVGRQADIIKFYPRETLPNIKIAEFVFTGQDGEQAVSSIQISLFPKYIEFDMGTLKCLIRRHGLIDAA